VQLVTYSRGANRAVDLALAQVCWSVCAGTNRSSLESINGGVRSRTFPLEPRQSAGLWQKGLKK